MRDSEAESEARVAAAAFCRRIDGVLDPAQWPVLVREFMAQPDADQAIVGLEALLRGAVCGYARNAWLAVAQSMVADGLDYDLLGRLYHAAIGRGLGGLKPLFWSAAKAHRTAREHELPRDDHLDSLTLGERKALARRPDVRMLERLLLDQSADVIEILLRNPKTTEPLVVRLAARRPVRREALEAVAKSSRWLSRYEVQRALVSNPYTPVRVASALAPLMKLPDLRELRRDGNLDPTLRDFARHLLTLRPELR